MEANRKENKKKWYNSNQMVGTLLIFWPPLGIYGVFKSETIPQKWKNVTYGALSFAVIGGILLHVI